MRLRITTLLLTVTLFAGFAAQANACCFIPILDPFHWLFGCGCYQGGYSGGYNQQAAFGNPGYSGYQPSYPGVMSSCAPCAPACLPSPICLRPLPMPAIFRQALDPCGYQCSAPMMPAPMVQYQPAPFVPQQPYAQPMQTGCDEGSDANGMMPMGMPYADPGMQNWGATVPSMAWSPQQVYTGGGFPSLARHSSLPPTGYGLFVRPRVARRETRQVIHQYRRMRSQSTMLPGQNRGPLLVPAPYSYPQAMYQQPMYSQPYAGEMGYPQMPQYENQSVPMLQPTQPLQQSAPQQQSEPQAMLYQSYPTMPSNMMPSNMMPTEMMYSNPGVAGDIMGDHEYSSSSAAMVPVYTNAYRNSATSSPFSRATLTRSLPLMSSQYSKSVR